MSQFTYCPRGGQHGILTTRDEQIELADLVKTKFIDTYIPLPGITVEDQVTLIKRNEEPDPNTNNNAIYWENEEGGHGWCDRITGQVIQWG